MSTIGRAPSRPVSLSFTQLRKLRETHEYTFAMDAHFSRLRLRLLDPNEQVSDLVGGIAGMESWLKMDGDLSLERIRVKDEEKHVRWTDAVEVGEKQKNEDEGDEEGIWDKQARRMVAVCNCTYGMM